MSNRFSPGEVVYKAGYVGFAMRGGYAVICAESDRINAFPCTMPSEQCGDPECVEWVKLRLLPGDSKVEAEESKRQGRFTGVTYYVGECELDVDHTHVWSENLPDPLLHCDTFGCDRFGASVRFCQGCNTKRCLTHINKLGVSNGC